MPPTATTATSTAPAVARPGAFNVTVVSEVTAMSVAATPSKVTEVTSTRLVPVIVTDVPADSGPTDGEMVAMVGAATKRRLSPVPDVSDEPPGVVTSTSTVAAVARDGAVSTIEVSVTVENEVTATVPSSTLVTPSRSVPVMVMEPPASERRCGEILVTVGRAK